MSKQTHDNKHLTLDERKIIQTGIENRSNKVDIARTIGKDPTTVAKEIRKHRTFKPRNQFIYPSICIHRQECGGCKKQCSRYEEIKCNKRDKSPGACNKCPKIATCHLDKYFYYATHADEEYKTDLVDYREGINMTTLEVKELANILKPLLDQGQSLYQIKSSHKEKTSESMAKSLYNLENKLGHDLYRELFSLILTDRGVEFEKVDLFEINQETGEFRTNIFYCDAYQSSQKPHVENTHNYIRDIIPNEIDMSNITQEDLDLMFSHINSTPRNSLKDKTPYEVFKIMMSTSENQNRGKEILDLLNIKEIKRDEVVLKPYLIKHNKNK